MGVYRRPSYAGRTRIARSQWVGTSPGATAAYKTWVLVGGTWLNKPTAVKIAGTFTNKPTTVIP